MLSIKFLIKNVNIVKQNIKNKFQNNKLIFVDNVIKLYNRKCYIIKKIDFLRFKKNKISKIIGKFKKFKNKYNKKIYKLKKQVLFITIIIKQLLINKKYIEKNIHIIMIKIPNIIEKNVPIGKDSSKNVELNKYGNIKNKNFKIPYHIEIMKKINGINLNDARKVAGNGFYYLSGDIAILHSAIISYAKDFMINKGFIYYIPPFVIKKNIALNVMDILDINNMMYKIENKDLYLIGTSEHSIIGKFANTIIPEYKLPQKITSYSPCFRKEKGAHGIEERGIYRVHQFEKQEMIIICKQIDSKKWFNKLLKNTINLCCSLNIPVRTIECCSGDLNDLKIKSIDIEAWSPRQKIYFEVGSCSNLGDSQSRRLKIRVINKKTKKKYLPYTLNNTVIASPRILIAFLENNLKHNGIIEIPNVLKHYMKNKIIKIN